MSTDRVQPVEAAGAEPWPQTARRDLWRRAPGIVLHYDGGDDVLVAGILPGPVGDSCVVHRDLLIEFDDVRPGAFPSSLCVTGVAAGSGSRAVASAEEILGPQIWTAAMSLVGAGGGHAEVGLEAGAAWDLEAGWAGLAEWARKQQPVVGIEVLPDEVRAGRVDSAGTVTGTCARTLTTGSPDEVVDIIVELLAHLEETRLVGVSIGGPVDPAAGVVDTYGKQRRGPDWSEVKLGGLLRDATGRKVVVVNDADALAHWEIVYGVGSTKFAVAIVGAGVGGSLAAGGEVLPDLPMELGMTGSVEIGANERAIVSGVSRATGVHVESLDDVCRLASGTSRSALRARRELGERSRRLARQMGNLQVFANPRTWVVYLPEALYGAPEVVRKAYLDGLRGIDERVGYPRLQGSQLRTRTKNSDRGIAAAAVSASRIWERGIRR